MPNKKRPVEWNGIRYDSVGEAAEANYVTVQAMGKWLRRGYTCDADVPNVGRPGNTCVVKGIEYDSMADAARANGVSETTIRRWLGLD